MRESLRVRACCVCCCFCLVSLCVWPFFGRRSTALSRCQTALAAQCSSVRSAMTPSFESRSRDPEPALSPCAPPENNDRTADVCHVSACRSVGVLLMLRAHTHARGHRRSSLSNAYSRRHEKSPLRAPFAARLTHAHKLVTVLESFGTRVSHPLAPDVQSSFFRFMRVKLLPLKRSPRLRTCLKGHIGQCTEPANIHKCATNT